MARFLFKLEGVLRHRERVEKDRQRELAALLGQMAILEAELDTLNQDVRQTTTHVRDHHLIGQLNMPYLAAHRRYMLGMQRKVFALAEKMALQQRQVDEARKMLGEASKEKKILEKLREKQEKDWTAALARREANDLDELTTQMSFRQLEQAEGAP